MDTINFPYKWYLKNNYFTKGILYHDSKVFSCFSGGGGSTMGYKLAGYNVIGCNEIDDKLLKCYIKNHNPKYVFDEPIQKFKNKEVFPKELYELDILDGSPPCSSFSISGNREKDWGKNKKFREGQKVQILDTLFFDFLNLAEHLQPKIILVENVTGILFGNAVKYAAKIRKEFKRIGYSVNYILLDSSNMGVPQKRKRVFFYAVRNDLLKYIKKIGFFNIPYLNLNFNLPIIPFKKVNDGTVKKYYKLPTCILKYFDVCKQGKGIVSVHPKGRGHYFNLIKIHSDKVCPTITADCKLFHYEQKRFLTKNELCKVGTFPLDFNFLKDKLSYSTISYIIGMSVPPVMIAHIAHQIKLQWLDKIKNKRRNYGN